MAPTEQTSDNANENTKSLYLIRYRWRKNGEVNTRNAVRSSKQEALREASRAATPMKDEKYDRDFLVTQVIEQENGYLNFSSTGSPLNADCIGFETFDSRERDLRELVPVESAIRTEIEEDKVESGDIGFVEEVNEDTITARFEDDQRRELSGEEFEIVVRGDEE